MTKEKRFQIALPSTTPKYTDQKKFLPELLRWSFLMLKCVSNMRANKND